MVEVGRDLWRSSGPTSLLKQGHLELVVQDQVQMINISRKGDSTTSLGSLCQCSWHCVCALSKVFRYVQREPPVLQFVPIASCPVTGHH